MVTRSKILLLFSTFPLCVLTSWAEGAMAQSLNDRAPRFFPRSDTSFRSRTGPNFWNSSSNPSPGNASSASAGRLVFHQPSGLESYDSLYLWRHIYDFRLRTMDLSASSPPINATSVLGDKGTFSLDPPEAYFMKSQNGEIHFCIGHSTGCIPGKNALGGAP